MARHKLHQVPLVSEDDATQPPLPGGWALVIFDSLHTVAPALAEGHRLPISDRTDDRIRKGKSPVKRSTYDEIEAKLVEVAASVFPKTAEVTNCVGKYVKEYFRLWTFSVEAAPAWVKIRGFHPSLSSVLARALVRDLVLRLCYLESCERKLCGENFSEWELALLHHDSPMHVYRALVSEQKLSRGLSQKGLAKALKIDEKALYRFRKGHQVPQFRQLHVLKSRHENHRLLAGIVFWDALLRRVNLRDGDLAQESLHWAESFLPRHRATLDDCIGTLPCEVNKRAARLKQCDFAAFVSRGEHLLVQPGIEALLSVVPDPLLRCHLFALRFARFMDLAQAYFQFAEQDNERGLDDFLRTADRESGGCPCHWINNLMRDSNVLSFHEAPPFIGTK